MITLISIQKKTKRKKFYRKSLVIIKSCCNFEEKNITMQEISKQEFMDSLKRYLSNEDELYLYYYEVQSTLEHLERKNF